MRVILQEKIENLGNIGDQIFVKPGYARNFLFPYGKAIPATLENIAEFEKNRTELEKLAAAQLERTKARAKKLEGKTFRVIAKASDEGKLFGSVGVREIAAAISSRGINIQKREVSLPEGPIRQIGEYEVPIHLHANVTVILKVEVVSE
ncbi:MAG: 50S ribosomal protein L9 [Coxiella endosymbiont of Dermacentor silvarum]